MRHEDFDDYVETARSLLSEYESASDLWEANECINAALNIRPGDAPAWILKSQVLSALEDDPGALAAAEMAVRRAPKCTEVHYVRATVLADMDRYKDALRAINRAFRCVHGDDEWLIEDLYYEKAAILDAMNRADEAVAIFESGLKRCPNSSLLKSGLEPLRRERVRRTFKIIDGGKVIG